MWQFARDPTPPSHRGLCSGVETPLRGQRPRLVQHCSLAHTWSRARPQMQISLNLKAVQFGFVCADLKNVLMRKKRWRTQGRPWVLCFSGNCKPSPLEIAFCSTFLSSPPEACAGIRYVAPTESGRSCVFSGPCVRG